MVKRFRIEEEQLFKEGVRSKRQFIVAVTANCSASGSEFIGPDLFDQVCPKPMNIEQLSRFLLKRFHTRKIIFKENERSEDEPLISFH
jgi:hypothetical protein